MDFNNNNMFGGREPSRRDKLEIGNDGKTTAEKKKNRQEEQQRNYMEMDGKGGGYGGRGGRFRDKIRRGRNGRGGSYSKRGSGGGLSTIVIAVVLIGLPIFVVAMLFTGNLNGFFRSFLATPEQNTNTLFQGFYDSQNLLHDSFLTDDEREQVAIYRKNEISRLEYIDGQVYPEYLVYVYSDKESKNEKYNDFVLEAEDKGFPVPIFRISADLTKDYFITDTVGVNEPVFLIFRNNTGKVKFDSMVNDAKQFNKLDTYMQEIMKQDDEYYKNRTGSYGDAEWLNPKEERVKE